MQTALADFIKDDPQGRHAEEILRKCVHCGFCLATCPTYQLLGSELDSPRGRIYLIKQVLEGAKPTGRTLLHLDRCLTCRACETTCPSGVRFGALVDIGRDVVEASVRRSPWDRLKRRAMAAVLHRRAAFGAAFRTARRMRFVLPRSLAEKLPRRIPAPGAWPAARHSRRMVCLAGCVQPELSPDINAAAARILDRIGISLVEPPGAGCCGALRFHMNFQQAGRSDMRALIDAWWPHVESGAEAFVMTASGCGSTVKEYGQHLGEDPHYAEKAARISSMTRDVAEVIAAEWQRLAPTVVSAAPERVAFHAPCSLQHAQALRGVVEPLLESAGFELAPVADAHLCCGSAGSYSLLQPQLSEQLKRNRLACLEQGRPRRILTANIGCQTHLASGTDLPVEHWIVALERRLARQ